MSKHKLVIHRTSEYYDCDQCGGARGEGAVAILDGVEIFRVDCRAHCFESSYVEDSEIYLAALKHLGVEVEDN